MVVAQQGLLILEPESFKAELKLNLKKNLLCNNIWRL